MNHNWEYKPFNLIANTITPKTKVDKSEYLQNGNIPIISQEESFISGYWNNPDDITPISNDVIIFGDHSRVVKYADFEFVVGADGVKIISPKECISPRFLYHFLKWYDVPSLGYARHFKLVKEAIYPVPPMQVQQQIVTELDKINKVIEDCRELLRSLDALAQSLFYNFFGDPITNPKDWETKPFEDCICKVKYPSKLNTNEYAPSGAYPIVSQEENLVCGYTDRFDCLFAIPKPIVVFGDHTRCLKYIDFDFTLGADGVKILCPINSISTRYFYYALLLFKIPSLGYSRHYKLLKELNIPVPPLHLQEKFSARIEQIELQKKAVKQTIAELQTLLNSRMDYWFN